MRVPTVAGALGADVSVLVFLARAPEMTAVRMLLGVLEEDEGL